MSGLADLAPRDRAWHPRALAPDYRSSVLRSPKHRLVPVSPGPGELNGPVFGHSALRELDSNLIYNYARGGEAIGERILVHGRVRDEQGRAVPNALIEIWQANASGKYRHVNDGYIGTEDPNFGGYGRCLSDADGGYRFRTVRPGPYPYPNRGCEWRPAHIHLSLFGPAFAQRLVTQLYFEGDPLIARCAIVNAICDPLAVDRLVARLDMDAMEDFDSLAYRFDIVLRGPASTPFESRPEGN